MPAKVAETGSGYTLSGKPLDPTSAAARAYGLKPEILSSKTVRVAINMLHQHSPCLGLGIARIHVHRKFACRVMKHAVSKQHVLFTALLANSMAEEAHKVCNIAGAYSIHLIRTQGM